MSRGILELACAFEAISTRDASVRCVACVGALQAGPGTPFGPAAMVGYIRGDGRGRFFGDVSLNSGAPIGTIHEKVDGHATADPSRGCIATVVYDKNSIELPGGVWIHPAALPR